MTAQLPDGETLRRLREDGDQPAPMFELDDGEFVMHAMDCCWSCFHGQESHPRGEECWCGWEDV